jgi:hypothetical protein
MTRKELKREIEEALDFLKEYYPVYEVEDIHSGYVSLYEAVIEVLDESGVKYDDEKMVEETLEEIVRENIERKNK